MGASCTRPKKQELFVRDGISQEDSLLITKLNEDLLTLILSFCSTAPVPDTVQQSFRIGVRTLSFVYRPGTSTLTHELPRVCHRFRHICYTSELLWIDAFAKALLNEEWNLRNLLDEWDCADLAVLVPEKTADLAGVKRDLQNLCRELSVAKHSTTRRYEHRTFPV